MRLLLVEDDLNVCHAICLHLKNEGYSVDSVGDGEDALSFIQDTSYDLIILDRLLPSLDGLSLLAKIRQEGIHTPVIMVTALSTLNDKIHGLDAGADDYLPKPFEMGELLARIRALTRRPSRIENQNILTLADISLDLSSSVLTGPKLSCSLSKREAALAEAFFRNPNNILPRSMILSKVWGPYSSVEDGNLDNYIHFLRRRLSTAGSEVKIKTIHAIGYRLEVPYANEA